MEKLRGVDLSTVGFDGEVDLKCKSECVAVLSSLAELCREEGAAGEANRMAVGEVCVFVCMHVCVQKFEL